MLKIIEISAAQDWIFMLADPGPRFYKHCYVHESHKLVFDETEGMVPFARIYAQRPDHCRWVILRNAQGIYVLTDLYEALTNDTRMAIFMGPVHEFADFDSAVAASQLLL